MTAPKPGNSATRGLKINLKTPVNPMSFTYIKNNHKILEGGYTSVVLPFKQHCYISFSQWRHTNTQSLLIEDSFCISIALSSFDIFAVLALFFPSHRKLTH